MQFVHVHTSDPHLARTLGVKHQGYWFFALSDGTYLVVVGCGHGTTLRQRLLSIVPTSTTILPNPKSANPLPVPATALSSFTGHVAALAQAVAAGTTVTTYTLLQSMFQMMADPILDPDSVE